ncbi:hypothetical protein [Pseudomonas oryzihabitans]|uniref:hypothetical protein n=1 Tax=Pseudomonas oryzihabitans TaxID=47885 RepID=UPI0030C37D6C
MEILLSAQFWITTVIGAILSLFINAAFPRFAMMMSSALRNSRAVIRVWYYRRVKKKLIRIKAESENQTAANRTVATNAVALLLFILAISTYPFIVILAITIMPSMKDHLFWWMIGLSTHIYIFELSWVINSRFLDDLISYQARKQRRR